MCSYFIAMNVSSCWLKGITFYIAFLAPVGLILLINFSAFALVLRRILGLSERKLNKSDSFTWTQQVRGAIGILILLGLTWVFAIFAIDEASVVFYYLFAIFNTLQVYDLFLFTSLTYHRYVILWYMVLLLLSVILTLYFFFIVFNMNVFCHQ